MVTIKAVCAANNALSKQSLTTVFVGATSGIGLAAIEALLNSTTSPKIFIVGRSQSNFASILAKLQNLNTSAKLIFIEAQVSLLKDVDHVCANIKAQQPAIDLLWLSQGGLSLASHELTPEGLNTNFAIKYYSRTLFMRQLIPLLNKSSDPRIISVLAAGTEGAVNTTDLGISDPKNSSFFPARKQSVTMMSLAMREMSLENPKISFIHTNPGIVSTALYGKFADTMTGYLTVFSWLLKAVVIPLMYLFAWTPEEAGQYGLYELTDERFSASSGKNFFRLGVWGDAVEADASPTLIEYEEDGTGKKVWEHALGVFDKVLAQ